VARGNGSSDLAVQSAVQVWSATGRFRGSGFFVRRRLVATCAHVVKDLPDDVVVRWGDRRFRARVLVRDPPRQGETIQYEYPDLAFLGLQDFDNPVPILDGQPVAPGNRMLVVGASQINPDEQVGQEIREIVVIGESGGYLTLDGAQIVHGMSGSPVIQDGRVRAMLKSGPVDQGNAGYAVPAAEITRSLRRHRAVLGAYRDTRPALQRPRPGELLHDLLTAQVQAAKRFPYQVAELTRRRPPSLADVYVEQRAEARGRNNAHRRADAVFQAVVLTPEQMLRRHRNALVIGDAGGGKSTLLYSLIGESAAWWLGAGAPDVTEPPAGRTVPVLVAAVDLVDDQGWSAALARSVARNLGGLLDVELTADVMRRPPAYGAQWLILIDGLDEIPRRTQRDELVGTLAHRVAEYGTSSRFVVASREIYAGELAALRAGLGMGEQQRLGEYSLRPFDRAAFRTFAGKWFAPAPAEPQRARPEDFVQAIEVGRLAPLVQVPLLATISAIVYEESPHRPLPIDRAGLYGTFVDVLLTLRRSPIDARDGVRQQLRRFGAAAEAYGEFVFERRRECLSFLAARLLVDKVTLPVALKEWVASRSEPMPRDVTLEHVREILVGTGLVVPRDEDLVFLHQSFAEYLASLELVSGFRPKEWLRHVRDHGADSLGLFLFAAWVRAGNDPMPIVRELLGAERQRRYPYLQDVAAMIEDGGILVGRGPEAVDATWHALRRGSSRDSLDPVVGTTLRAVYQRLGADRLSGLLTDRRASVVERLEAAQVLITDGTPDERARTVGALVHLAYRVRLSDFDRLWALYYLAEYGGERERPHALQQMTAMVETAQRLAVRSRALALLAQADEVVAASTALARRAMDGGRDIAERLSTLELLTTFLVLETRPDMPPDRHAAGLELDEGVWRQARRGNGAGAISDRQAEVYIGQLAVVITTVARHDPVSAYQLAQRFVRDRGITWIHRASLLRGLRADGFPEIAEAALLAVARDSGEPAHNRVAMLELKRFDNHLAHDRESLALLTAWLYDPDQPSDLRQAALDSLLRDAGPDETRRLAGDRGLHVRLRISAAFRLTTTRAEVAEAHTLLRAMAAEEALSVADRLTVGFARAMLWLTGWMVRAPGPSPEPVDQS
jgi:Trypsin-like peptidase domain